MPDGFEHQRRLKAEIRDRVQDLTGDRRLAAALIETGFDILAAQHRQERLDAAELAVIQENSPNATPDLIAERAINEAGLLEAVSYAESFARIYIDYSPLSQWQADMRADQACKEGLAEEAAAWIAGMNVRWGAAGVSGFGVCCTLILTAASDALARGLGWPKVVRICLDAINMAWQWALPPSPLTARLGQVEEIMAMLGISRAAAQRYVAAARAERQ